jgi:hypothetical protein
VIESNKLHCRVCGELKVRQEDGKYPNSKNKRYIDENGKLWVGKKCAQCVVLQSKENMRKLRFKRHLEKRDEEPTST